MAKGGGNEAKQARDDEQKRQQRIRAGTERINSIFDGALVGQNQIAAGSVFDPKASYFTKDGAAWSPAAVQQSTTKQVPVYRQLRDGGRVQSGTQTIAVPGGKAPGAQQQFGDMLANGGLFSSASKSGGFNDDFFNGRKQAYLDYATPQLEDQYGKAKKELTFSLARSGLLDSSVRAQKTGELQQSYDLNMQGIADEALSQETQARNAAEDARSNLISTLNATGDAEGAANSALTRASALSRPATFSPLTQLFSDFTSTLGTQAALERANYYSGGQTGLRHNLGLYPQKANTVVVRK